MQTAQTPRVLLSISEYPRRIAAITGGPAPTARKTYESVLQGLFPAQRICNRWYFESGDERVAAQALGLTLKTAA